MITTPKAEKLDPRLSRDLNKVRGCTRESKQRFRVEFRASSFPICPRKYHIYRRLPENKRPFERKSIASDLATLPGTAMHLVLQEWFGAQITDHCYGNWECPVCSTPEHRVMKYFALGLQQCGACGHDMVYSEFEIKKAHRVPFTGHLDMVLWYREDDFAVILDYKGSTQKKIGELRSTGAYPKNYLQVNAYANAINLGEQDLGELKKIDKVALMYIDRGESTANQLVYQYPVSVKVYHETIALIASAKRSVKDMVLPRGLCRSIDDEDAKWCPVKALCFSPLLETLLEDTIQPLDSSVRDRIQEKRLTTTKPKD
jgi:hypothetical protein